MKLVEVTYRTVEGTEAKLKVPAEWTKAKSWIMPKRTYLEALFWPSQIVTVKEIPE